MNLMLPWFGLVGNSISNADMLDFLSLSFRTSKIDCRNFADPISLHVRTLSNFSGF